MKVGMILGEEDTSRISYSPCSCTPRVKNHNFKQEETNENMSAEDEMLLRIPSKGTLIIEGEPGESSKELTIETIDVDAFNEMYLILQRKNRFYRVILFILLLTNSFSMYQWYTSKEMERELNVNIRHLSKEKKKLKEQIVNSNLGGEQQCSFLCGRRDSHEKATETFFEMKNCYFNIQTKTALGPCSKDLQNSVQNWYEGLIYGAWWNQYFGNSNEEDANDSTKERRSGVMSDNNEESKVLSTENEGFGENNSIDDLIYFI